MDNKDKLSRKSAGYILLKLYVRFWLRHYYHITQSDIENIPSQGRFILTANHQNALIDALAILTSRPWPVVFLARSDIFKGKTVKKILAFLKILPIYRMRDGYDQLANNEEVFGEVFRVLDQNTPLGIMPEGNHDNRKLLRPLKKGVARIAFSYRHNDPGNLKDIGIIPIGLNYSDHHKEGSKLFCRFGAPIQLAQYDALYQENPPKAYKQFISDLHTSLKNLIVHVENMECYQVCSDVADTYESMLFSEGVPHQNVVVCQKDVISRIQWLYENQKDQFDAVEQTVASIKEHINSAGCLPKDLSSWKLTNASSARKLITWFVLLFTFPLNMYGFIQNLLPRFIVKKIKGLFKDPQFESTAIFAASIFVFPLIHLLQTIALGFIFWSFTIAILYAITLLPFYFIEKTWQKRYHEIRKATLLSKVKNKLKPLLQKLTELVGISYTPEPY